MMMTAKMTVVTDGSGSAEAVAEGEAVARAGGVHVVECGGDDEKKAVARVDDGAGVVRRRE